MAEPGILAKAATAKPSPEREGRIFRKRINSVKANGGGEYPLDEMYPPGPRSAISSLREKIMPSTVKNKPSTAFSFPLGDSPEDGWGSSTEDPEGTVAYLRRDKTPISNIVTTPGAQGEYNPRTGGIAVRATGAPFDATLRHEMIHKALAGGILPGQSGYEPTGDFKNAVGSPRLNELTNKMAKIWAAPGGQYAGNPLQEIPAYASLGEIPGIATGSDNLFSPAESKEYQEELDNFFRSRGKGKISDEISRLRKGDERMRSILPSDAYGLPIIGVKGPPIPTGSGGVYRVPDLAAYGDAVNQQANKMRKQ